MIASCHDALLTAQNLRWEDADYADKLDEMAFDDECCPNHFSKGKSARPDEAQWVDNIMGFFKRHCSTLEIMEVEWTNNLKLRFQPVVKLRFNYHRA